MSSSKREIPRPRQRRGIVFALVALASVIAYSSLALLLLLLFVWSPTPGFHRVPTAVLLILLSVVGLEFLRHQAVKDFPGETWDGATERWGSSLRSRFGGSS